MKTGTSIKDRVFSGTLWMAAISFGQQILQFVLQIVLARLLLPHDYGAAAIVMTVCVFATVFSSAGIGTAIVQRKELPDSVKDAAAVITGGMALLLGGVVFTLSGLIASFYKLPELSILFRIAAIDIFLKVMISLYDSLMLRALQYRSLSVRAFIGLVVQGVVSIILARIGWGARSLVIGYVSGSFVQLVLCVGVTRYIPHSYGSFHEVVDVFKFGGWVLLGRIANQAAATLDQVIVARFLNAASIGLINVSKHLSSILPNTIIGFSGRITLSVFSRWQEDIQRIESNYWRGVRVQLMIATPLCALVALCSYQILALLFGAKWLAGTSVMKIYALQATIIAMEGSMTGSVINAMGKPKFGTLILVGSLFLMPLCSYTGSQFGIIGVAWAFVGYAIVVVVADQFILWWQFNFHVINILVATIRQAVATLPMFLAGLLILHLGFLPFDPPPAIFSVDWFLLGVKLIVSGLTCMGVYCLTARFLLREDFLYVWRGLGEVLHNKGKTNKARTGESK